MNIKLLRCLLLVLAVVTAGGEAWAETAHCRLDTVTGPQAKTFDKLGSGAFPYDRRKASIKVKSSDFFGSTIVLNVALYGWNGIVDWYDAVFSSSLSPFAFI